MWSIELIRTIHWINHRWTRTMHAIEQPSGDLHAWHWPEIPRLRPHRRRLERPRPRFQAVQPELGPWQMAGVLLLAQGFHLRLPDRDRGFRQAREAVPRPRRAALRSQHRLGVRAPRLAQESRGPEEPAVPDALGHQA